MGKEEMLKNANSELGRYVNDVDNAIGVISFYKERLEEVGEMIRDMITENVSEVDGCTTEYPSLAYDLKGMRINSEIKRLLNSLSYQASAAAKKF